MSVLMAAGRKGSQDGKKKKKTKKKVTAIRPGNSRSSHSSSSHQVQATAPGPPLSTPETSVWYWLLDGQPTTVTLNKGRKEVWCNGFIVETYDGFVEDEAEGDPETDVGDVIDFEIFSAHTQRSHRGRIERLPLSRQSWIPGGSGSAGLCIGSHRLWVDDCHIPEYTDQPIPQTNLYGEDDDDFDDDDYDLEDESVWQSSNDPAALCANGSTRLV